MALFQMSQHFAQEMIPTHKVHFPPHLHPLPQGERKQGWAMTGDADPPRGEEARLMTGDADPPRGEEARLGKSLPAPSSYLFDVMLSPTMASLLKLSIPIRAHWTKGLHILCQGYPVVLQHSLELPFHESIKTLDGNAVAGVAAFVARP